MNRKPYKPHKQIEYDKEEDSSQEQHMGESSFVTLDKSLQLDKEESEGGDTEIICSSKLDEDELVPVYIKQSELKNFKTVTIKEGHMVKQVIEPKPLTSVIEPSPTQKKKTNR